MKRRDFLKTGVTITALAAISINSPYNIVYGETPIAVNSDTTPLFTTTSGQNATLFRSERILVDYCTARSLKMPQSPISGERLPMFDL